MELADYFENTKGIGLLATAGADGEVDAAIYSLPHFVDDETVDFFMAGRLSYRNVIANPHATYAFIEHGEGCKGKRLYLTRKREGTDSDRIEASQRQPLSAECSVESGRCYRVRFRIDRVRPLVGD